MPAAEKTGGSGGSSKSAGPGGKGKEKAGEGGVGLGDALIPQKQLLL